MLKISPAVTVNNVPGDFPGMTNDYILYPDSDDPNTYYAMAENPTLLYQGKTPAFNLTWYFGSEGVSGGICTMTVVLPMPNLDQKVSEKETVRDLIRRTIGEDPSTMNIAQKTLELCQATKANEADKVAQLKKDLGYDDAIAKKKQDAWDGKPDWRQFMPRDQLKLSPVPYKTGTVTVQAFADPSAYKANNAAFTGKFETTPSNFNSNAAVVTFQLSDLGANLFWHGLGGWSFDPGRNGPDKADPKAGGNSVISVVYKVDFDGLLPEASATVTVSHDTVAKLITATKKYPGAWGTTYSREVVDSKEYQDAINSATKIYLPAVVSGTDKDNVQKLLTDWAAAQLAAMTQAQFPTVSLADLSLDGPHSIRALQTQSRRFNLTQAVTLQKLPQAQLPKISALGVDVRAAFQLINLNEVPYTDVNIALSPPPLANLNARQVDRFVVADVTYAGNKLVDPTSKAEVSTVEYVTTSVQPGNSTLTGRFAKNGGDPSVKYSYLVSYNDGTPTYRAPAIEQKDYYLDLGGLDIGVLSAQIDGRDLPWDVISGAKVDLVYDTWKKSVTLKRDMEPQLVSKPFGQAIDKTLTYQVTLTPTVGAPVVGPVVPVPLTRGHAEISLQSPLGNMVDTIQFALGTAVTSAQLRVEYTFKSKEPPRVFTQLVQLNSAKDGGVFKWKVPRDSEFKPSLRILKARTVSGAGTKDLTDLGGPYDPLDVQANFTVDADGISDF